MKPAEINALRKKYQKNRFTHDQKYKAGKYCVMISDCGGEMPCVVDTTAAVYFKSFIDFVAWLRYFEIPAILSLCATESNKIIFDEKTLIKKLAKISPELLQDAKQLMAMLDKIIQADSKKRYPSIVPAIKLFNKIFTKTEPMVSIDAIGHDLLSWLSQPFFKKQIANQCEEGSEKAKKLQGLINAKKLSSTNAKHVKNALGVISAIENY